MRMGNIRVRATLATAFVSTLTLQLWGQVATPTTAEPARNPFAGDPKAVTQGASRSGRNACFATALPHEVACAGRT
jgi:hypothetical protein